MHEFLKKQLTKCLVFAAVLVLGILYFGKIIGAAMNLWRIVTPLVLGFSIAYILNIPMKKMERIYFPKAKNAFVTKTRKPMSLLLSVVIIAAILVAVILIVLPQVFKTLASVTDVFPSFLQEVNAFVAEHRQLFPEIARRIEDLNLDWESITNNMTSYLSTGISSLFGSSIGIVTNVAAGIFDLVMAIAFSIYLLLGKERLIGQVQHVLRAFVKKEHIEKLSAVFAVANQSFSSFISGQCMEGLIIGVLCTLGMLVFRFPYATTIGVFVGATALIPIVGAYLGAGVGAMLVFMVNPMQAVWFIVFILILQQLEGNLIYPRVVGTSIGLPGIWVLAAVLIGGGLGGILGMLLGVPLAATAYKLLQTETRERLGKIAKQ